MSAMERSGVARLLSNLEHGALRRLRIASASSGRSDFQEQLGTLGICREIWRCTSLTALHLSSPCHAHGAAAATAGLFLDLSPLQQLRELHLEGLLTGEGAEGTPTRLRFGAQPHLSRLAFCDVEAHVEEGPAAFPALEVLRLSGDYVPVFSGPHHRQMLAHVSELQAYWAEASRVRHIIEYNTLPALRSARICGLPSVVAEGAEFADDISEDAAEDIAEQLVEEFKYMLRLLLRAEPRVKVYFSRDVLDWFQGEGGTGSEEGQEPELWSGGESRWESGDSDGSSSGAEADSDDEEDEC